NVKVQKSYKLLFVTISYLLLFCSANTVVAQVKKGDKYVEEKRYLDAITAYEKAVKKEPKGTTYTTLGQLYQKTKQYPKAKEAFSKALTYDELPVTKFIDYAKICLQTEDF